MNFSNQSGSQPSKGLEPLGGFSKREICPSDSDDFHSPSLKFSKLSLERGAVKLILARLPNFQFFSNIFLEFLRFKIKPVLPVRGMIYAIFKIPKWFSAI